MTSVDTFEDKWGVRTITLSQYEVFSRIFCTYPLPSAVKTMCPNNDRESV